jgi:hypothetical protein
MKRHAKEQDVGMFRFAGGMLPGRIVISIRRKSAVAVSYPQDFFVKHLFHS